jgi:diguanylate cyclase (GGDEF)-like protein
MEKMELKSINFAIKIELILISSLLLILVLGLISYKVSKQQLEDSGKLLLKNAVEMTLQEISTNQKLVIEGKLTLDAAQENVREYMLGEKKSDGTRPINKNINLGTNGYLLAYTQDGHEAAHPFLEGQDVWNVQDKKDGSYLVQNQIKIANNGGGYLTYWWVLPNSDIIAQKITYQKVDPNWNWIICAGTYMSDFNKGSNQILKIMIVVLVVLMIIGGLLILAISRNIAAEKQIREELEHLSYHDQLTGLYNRRFFEEELTRLDLEKNLPLTIVMADVNGLKLVNDSFGHAVGDELLKKVTQVMKKGFRKDNVIARLAGDEFVVLLPNTNTMETEKIIKNIKATASGEKVGTIDLSISFGFQTMVSQEEKIQDVLKKAEDFMYKKKLFEGPSMRGKTINTIISTLHEKNKREEQHSHRVSKLCESMGIALELTEDEIKELKTIGLLHDIGKIALEENILNKSGKLTDEEFEEIKRHPEIGYRILSTVNDLSEIAGYVLAHHERYDGKGYPKGLKEENIPLQSRIIAIVDAYDAMVSERSYRNALSEEVAIEELKRSAGSQFDASLTKVFIEKILNKEFDQNISNIFDVF